ncbi:NAD-dependent epimerase/dehydratase family protein [Algivirga pacifica]|uniref:SDR family oxidoreductase n=1 Tax=Algivirga pacifica TaxID=1162670 RepID=A0ABP9D940_9BACT
MRYFITGCSGFVGEHIARKVILEGGTVRASKRSNSNTLRLKDLEQYIEWVDINLLDPEAIAIAIKDCNAIIHTAAMVSFDSSKAQSMEEFNVQSTANIVNVALENNIPLCYVSSIAAVGSSSSNTPINENQKWEDSAENSAYSISKYHAEQEVWRGVAEGLKAVILNPSVILGHGDWQRSSLKIFNYILNEGYYYPQGYFSYVDVRDVANLAYRGLTEQKYGERFILNSGSLPYQKVFQTIARYFDVRPPQKALPIWMGGIAAKLEALRTRIFGGEPKITKDLIRSSSQKKIYSSQKAISTFEYAFYSLEDTMKWVKKNYNNT